MFMAIDENLNKYIMEERTFLHDISNQLVIVQGMGDFILSALEKTMDAESKEVVRMQKVMKATRKIGEMVINRREYVKSLQD